MKRSVFVLATPVVLLFACLFAMTTSSAEDTSKVVDNNVTFTKDVAPIFYKNCTACHRPGEVAPMSLLTYKDARPWAKAIREKVVEKQMPPWHADPRHGEWLNDRRISQEAIDTIAKWVDGGAREGDPKDLPPAPEYAEGWRIGKPDQTFSIPEQAVPADGVVSYQYLTVPTNLKVDRWITAAEIRSTGRDVVHHVIVFVQEPGTTRAEGRLLVGFAPGEQPAMFAPGFAKKVPAGSNLVFQVHYTPNGTATKNISTVGLIYAKTPVKYAVVTRPVLETRFVIPAGDPNYEVKSAYTFNEPAHLYSFMPHMHLRGKDFVYRAVFPDGTSKILLSVPNYDFSWQTYYVAKEPVAVPKGTRIECLAHYDNSTNNKYNPDPTKAVRWGDQTWEEMMIGWMSFVYDNPSPAKPTESKSGQ
ncbi:MAG TPA: cytochrome c [Pyrinomonadaceae bacterium]|nr:cytochrome c [Pyrinomonadaceae bacterium]